MTREHRGSVELVRSSNECIGDFEAGSPAGQPRWGASQPRKRSVVQISESRPGHFASIRRLPNCPLFISNTRDSVSTSLAQKAVTLEALAVLIHKVVIQHSTSVLADSISGANGHKPIVDRPLKEDWNDDKLASGCTV